MTNIPLNENVAFTVKYDVSKLVKKSKPKLVVSLPSVAQLNDCLIRRYPSSSSTCTRTGHLRNDDHSDSCARAVSNQLRPKLLGAKHCQSAQHRKKLTKTYPIVWTARNL